MTDILLNVSRLYCYPVKSCGCVELESVRVDRRGIAFDRQWMVVDERGVFVTQRQIPAMAQITPQFVGETLMLTAPRMRPLILMLYGARGERLEVKVWNSDCAGIDQGEGPARWFTEYLSKTKPGKYRLLRFDEEYKRCAKTGEAELAFGDGYPFLVTSAPSLSDLNSRLGERITMDRFRPNIIIACEVAYLEDQIALMQIRDVVFQGMSQCARCNIINTNQETAEVDDEPFRVLRSFRNTEKGPVFGRNFNHLKTGIIRQFDKVRILERR